MIRIARITRCNKLVLLSSAALLVFGSPLSKKPSAVLAAPIGSSTMAPAALHAHYFADPEGEMNAAKWGEITIAQPKVWQYERVNALLDGLLRDVEGVSLANLTQLDPNKSNAAAIRFVQSALGISVTYDQAALVNNSNILQTWQLKHETEVRQLDEYNNYTQGLNAQRDRLTRDLFATNNQIVALQTKKDSGGSFTASDVAELQAATDRATTLNGQLKDVNTMISSAGAAPTLTAPPTPAGTSATAPALPSPSSLGDLIKSLPDGVQKSISNALQSPTYPATKQMDNFITLLHERLAREISVMQDDLIRDPNTFAYLVQFDVGLYPSKKSKNHMARVEFDVVDCSGCKVYSLYPGQSSYNVTNYQGSSKRRSFVGNLMTLIGLGISANYQRQEDALKGSLVQSVYVSGFQQDDEAAAQAARNADPPVTAANQRFGWYYSAAPFDEYVTPGIRSTFAIVTVPRAVVQRHAKTNPGEAFPLRFSTSNAWPPRDKPKEIKDYERREVEVGLPATKDLIVQPPAVTDDPQRLHILRMEYNPIRSKKSAPVTTAASLSSPAPTPTPAPVASPSPAPAASPSGSGCKKDECATILLTLDVPIDPNLVITVHGSPLRRVRDWRGRATSVLPPVQSLSDIAPTTTGAPTPKSETVASRSLLETDQLEPNSWYVVNSHDLLLTISRDLAGEESFPVIQISDPGKRTLVIPNDLRQNFTEVIFDGFRLLPATGEAFNRYLKLNFAAPTPTPTPAAAAATVVTPVAIPVAAPAADAPLFQGGPYPYSTFVPLFQSNVAGQEFYAIVGETGHDLIIGFKRNSIDSQPTIPGNSFLEGRTSAVLEDTDLDLAWSLQCANQGEELVCKLPIDSIRAGYEQLLRTCPGQNSCPSIAGLLASLRNPLLGNKPSDTTLGSAAFVPSLQVWVAQFDPEGKNSFWSPGPTRIGMFPLGDAFVSMQRFRTWYFDPFRTTSSNFSIEACNYFGGDARAARIQYLTPSDFPEDLVPEDQSPTNRGQNCGSIQLPTLSFQFPEIVVQTKVNNTTWTDAIPISRLRPHFGRTVVTPIYDLTVTGDKPRKIAGWDFKIPVNRVHCQDQIDFPPGFMNQLQQAIAATSQQIGKDPSGRERADFEWLYGNTTIVQSGDHRSLIFATDGNGYCHHEWWENQTTGRIQLHFTLPKQFLSMLPGEIPLIRTNRQAVGIVVARLPDLRKLVLPSKLRVELVGEGQFALLGKNAGAIDAVLVQNGKFFKQYPTANGLDVALVKAVVPDTSETSGQTDGKKKKLTGKNGNALGPVKSNPPTGGPATPSATANAPAGGTATPPATANPPAGGAATPPATANPPTGGAATPPATANPQAKPKYVPLDPGTYTLVPLVYDGKNYVPIEVTDEQGKALTYTVPPKKDAPKDNPGTTPDETVTITKTTKKPGPAATPSATPAK